MTDVKIGGHEYKKWQVAAVGIGGGAAVLFIFLRRKQAAAAAAPAADTTTAAAADQAAGSGYGNLSGYGTTYGPTGSYTTALGYTSGGGYASNADWAQAVESGLTDIGYTPTDVASAVGRYLGQLPLSADQQNIVSVARAEFGDPPSGALPIIAAGQGTATSGGSTATSVVSGGHAVSVSNNDAVIAWNHAGPATQWRVTRTGPGGTVSNTVGIPEASYSGLSAGHNYEVTVQPLPAGEPGKIDFKTTATKKG